MALKMKIFWEGNPFSKMWKTLLLLSLVYSVLSLPQKARPKEPPFECIVCVADQWIRCNETACDCFTHLKDCFNNTTIPDICFWEYYWLLSYIELRYHC